MHWGLIRFIWHDHDGQSRDRIDYASVGSVLFVASAVSKQKIETVVKAMLPFYAMLLIVLGMVTYIPAISLWLPGVLGMQ
jgi:sorbitol-specific phosphotransferase system component IIBC